MDYLLTGVKWVTPDGGMEGSVRIRNGIITEIGDRLANHVGEKVIHFRNHYLYPGLINSHDHLEMNLYSRLGNPPYGNYTQWGNDIYRPKESPILEIERTDIEDRLLWGGLKNMISGVTTVVHHNPWHKILDKDTFPVKVLKKFAWSHSLAFGKNLINDFPKDGDTPFVIHAAEGVDEVALDEITKLDELGLLRKNTILVHAVGLSEKDKQVIQNNRCSVVWCPASNLFLFNQTASIGELKKILEVSLGSDSTLTGSPTLLDEMRIALGTKMAASDEIADMVSIIPARIFNLQKPAIIVGAPADLMIIAATRENYFENLLQAQAENISLVIKDGEPVYGEEAFSSSLSLKHFFMINGIRKCAKMDVGSLRKRLKKKLDESILQSNPLWKMIDS